MIILLLILALSMSKDSTNDDYMSNTERPSVDSVRQLDYVQRMSENPIGNASDYDVNETGNLNEKETKHVNVNNGMSVNRINAMRNYISGKTVGLCDFTCHKCYRCTLVYDN